MKIWLWFTLISLQICMTFYILWNTIGGICTLSVSFFFIQWKWVGIDTVRIQKWIFISCLRGSHTRKWKGEMERKEIQDCETRKYQNPKWMRAKMRFPWQTVWLNRRFDLIKSCNPMAGGTNSVNPHNSQHSACPCQSLWAIQRREKQNP